MNNLSPDAVFDLEYFFELSTEMACVAGYDGYFKKISPAVSETPGYNNEELLASPINSFVHPEDQETTAEKRMASTKVEALLNFENRYITKTGSVIRLLLDIYAY